MEKSRFIKILCLVSTLILSVACSSEKVSVVWTEGVADPETGLAVHTLTVLNAPAGVDWAIWMSSNYIDPGYVEGTEGTIELFHGCYYKMTPAEHSGDRLVVKYTDGALKRQSWAPEGFALENNGKVQEIAVKYEFLPTDPVEDFPYNHVKTEVWDMIPSLKNVTPSEGITVVGDMPEVEYVNTEKEGWYKIVLDGNCKVMAADEDGAMYAKVTLDNLKRNAGGNEIPNMVIEDWPDLGYRGFMLDISRNFTSKDNILKFIDLLAHYILLLICSFVSSPANAEEKPLADSISLGYGLNEVLHTSSRSVAGVGAGAFENASAIDVSKSLYGKIAGLNVYQGSGTSSDNDRRGVRRQSRPGQSDHAR